MAVYGYIFLPASEDQVVIPEEQRRLLTEYGVNIGLTIESYVIEEGVSLRKPFRDRPEGGKLLNTLQGGEGIAVLNAAWVLASAAEGVQLLKDLRKRAISMYCADLQENISMPGERKLVISEGGSLLVAKLLAALAICECSSHGEVIKAVKRKKRREGKYLGGPVPFGWRVDDSGFLTQDEKEQLIVGEIRVLRKQGLSFRDIANRLADSSGISLSHEGIRRLLASDTRRKAAQKDREAGRS